MFRLCLIGLIFGFALTVPAHAAEEDDLLVLLNRLESAEREDSIVCLLADIEAAGIKSPSAVPRLTPYLQVKSSLIKISAAMALRAVGADSDVVRGLLKDKDPMVRTDLVWHLLHDDEPPESFLHMLDDPSPKVRGEVAASLLAHGIDPIRVRGLLKDSDGKVRAKVAVALMGKGEDPSRFLDLLKDPSAEVRGQVGVHCVRAGVDHKHLRPLLKDPDAGVRSSLGSALMRLNSEPVWECVLAWLDTPYKIEKYDVFAALGPEARVNLAPHLFDRLKSDDKKQRARCLRVLQNLKEIPRSLHNRIPPMASSKHTTIRRATPTLVRQLDQDQLVATLRVGLRDSSESVCIAAIKVARRRRCTELLKELTSLFEAKTVEVRLAAAKAVAVLDREDKRCVQVMLEAVDPKDHKSMRPVCEALTFAGQRSLAARDLVRQTMDMPLQHGLFDIMGRMDPPGLNVAASLGEAGLPWVREWLADDNIRDRTKARILSYLDFRGKYNSQLEPSLLKLLETTESGSVRSGVVSVLSEIGTTQPERLKPFTEGDLARELPAVLGRCHGDSKALGVAIDMLEDMLSCGDPRVRFAACKALHRHLALRPSALDSLTEWIQGQDDATDSLKSEAEMLAWIGPKAKPAMVELLEALERGKGKAFPIEAVRKVGMDPIAELRSGLASERASYRHACAAAAAELKDPQLRPVLIRELNVVRPVRRGMAEYRQSEAKDAMLHAIAAVGPTEDLIPELRKLVREKNNTGAAARALGGLGPKAKSALPTLMRYDFSWLDKTEIEVAHAIAKIQQSPIGLSGVKRCLRLGTENPLHASPYFNEVIDLIVQLGERSRHLREQLVDIVEGLQLMHPESRIHAAFALAKLYPDEPRWRDHLRSWKSFEQRRVSLIKLKVPATDRLQQLDAVKTP